MTIDTSKVFKATVWSGLENIFQQVILVIVQLTLARLLGPRAFGLVAMLTIFYAISQAVVDSGFANAIIQKKQVTQTDCSSVFYFNIVLGILVSGLLCLASPWIAAFYDQPILVPLTCALSLMVVINSFGLIQHALLKREMQFKKLLTASLPASFVSGVVGIVMALLGFGVWAIVGQMLSLRLFWVVLMWRASPWRPTREYSWSAIRQMFGFGSNLMAIGIITVIFDNLYFLVIGRIFDAVALGLYSNARRLQLIVSRSMNTIVSRVAFPTFSQVQDNKQRLREGSRRALISLSMISGLGAAIFLATADPMFRGLLGHDWIGAIPYMQWLAVLIFFFPISGNRLDILKGMGRSDLVLQAGLAKQALIAINLIVAWRWGILAIVIGQVIVGFISFIINAYFAGRLLQYSARRQLRDLIPSMLIAAGACLVMLGIQSVLQDYSPFITLAAQIPAGLIFWAACGYIFDLTAYRDFTTIIHNLRTPKTTNL